MRKKDLENKTNEELLSYLAYLGGQQVKEINFGRGSVTKSTSSQIKWICEELEKRFGIDSNRLLSSINETY